MSDVLSQNEIDDLLSALSTGEVDVKEIEDESNEKKVRKYDFSRPDKFAKDQLRTLEIIHENFSRLLNNFLSGYLRTVVEIQVLSVQSLIYNEFSNSIPNPAILGIVNFSPLEGQIIIEVSSELAFSMIERVLGSDGSITSEKESRSLTEIELTLMRNVLMKFINLLKEPWSNIIELRPKLETIETNSQFAQIVSPSESIALVTFSLKIGETEGMINIAIPHFVIEPILPNLSSKLWFSNSSKKPTTEIQKESLSMNVEKTSVNIKVVAGRTNISVLEMLTLSVGDVIVLDKNVNEDFEIYIENDRKFKAKPGKKNSKIAARITENLEEGDESNG
ncbi:flagellar motor switch protein FliM [Helicovermis profundi]|uniref:Flagellar motor switch protein FliM n=1 Tax=Helicovermis profundi TaxID=3065157 RepID=A0AAU9E7H4_9FIRM|nr:flagellar motor switch protein FliM [Clostridia bacterium S502]